MTGTTSPRFEWRRVTPADFPLLAHWLAQPHVHRWWHHEFTPTAVERDFGPATRGAEPGEDLLVSADGVPIGLVQRCRLDDYPDYRAELAELVDVPDESVSIDYLIGDPDRVGHGLGPAMLRAIIAACWVDHPRAECVIVPVVAVNRASWRALEKAGLHRVATGELTPDNPADGRSHVVYRIDRPRSGTDCGECAHV